MRTASTTLSRSIIFAIFMNFTSTVKFMLAKFCYTCAYVRVCAQVNSEMFREMLSEPDAL